MTQKEAERAAQVGFWEGVALLILLVCMGTCGLFLHAWVGASLLLGIALPFTILGLNENRHSHLLIGRIQEIERQL